MSEHAAVEQQVISWLLEPDSPGVCYLALRDLLRLPAQDAGLLAARRLAHAQGPIAAILHQMQPDGYWCEPGPGYLPKYRSTVWALILLAQLGARIEEDDRIGRACAYLLDHTLTSQGQFTTNGAPSGTADCLQGNLCWALLELGLWDERLASAFDWMARSVTGAGVAPMTESRAPLRYYAGNCGPDFACGANNKQSCAWGAAKVMLAFSRLPLSAWTPVIDAAVQQGIAFLFSVDPASAAYPSGWSQKPSRNWWKFGFPVFYVTDLLQIVEALVGLGYAGDPRLVHALSLVRQKQDSQGRWTLDYHYQDKTWVEFGAPGQPSKWVTLRALRVLQAL